MVTDGVPAFVTHVGAPALDEVEASDARSRVPELGGDSRDVFESYQVPPNLVRQAEQDGAIPAMREQHEDSPI